MAMTRRQFALSAASTLVANSQPSEDLAGLSLAEASRKIRSGAVSPTQLTEACLERIRTYNPKINAWITVMRDQALAQAKVLGEEQRAGRIRSPLTEFRSASKITSIRPVYALRRPVRFSRIVSRPRTLRWSGD
jgi:Amidase